MTSESSRKNGSDSDASGVKSDSREAGGGVAHHTPRDLLPDLSQLQAKALEWLARNKGQPFSLILIYVDDIRSVNEAIGYAAGQQLLGEVVGRISRCMPEGSLTASMVAGYLLVLTPDRSAVMPDQACAKILHCVNGPISIDGHLFQISSSVGAVCFPKHGELLPDLFRRSMMALSYARRRRGNRYRIYDDTMGHLVKRRWRIGSRLRGAAEREEFELVYQPHVEANTGRIVGAEALMRWRDGDHGHQSPAEFVPLLEQSALIIPVGQWALHTACTQAMAWSAAGLGEIAISVNLSPRQVEHPNLVTDVAAVLETTGLPATRLLLEITESMLLRDLKQARQTIEALSVLGVRVVMDDFGTGYSSMNYLKHLPLWGIKLDRSFVKDLPGSPNDAEIAEAIIALARRLKLGIIAEGAETPEQVQFLRQHGVNAIQGFHYSPAVSADRFTLLLKDQPFKPA